MTCEISAAVALEHFESDWLDTLSDVEALTLAYAWDIWIRANQEIPAGSWLYFGFICGRGFGKSHAIACEVNRRVMCGEARCIALVAPTEDRADEVQIQFLIDTSPPWFRAERYDGGVRWPNGARAYVYSAEAPEVRGPNFDLAWLCEIVAWQASTRRTVFENVTTATRIGRAQVIWDTTSKGSNEVIRALLELNAADPESYPIQRGAMFDNPMLGADYLKRECAKYTPGTQRYGEEVLGLSYGEAAGALWKQSWLDDHRRHVAPTDPEIRIVAVDPAHSAAADADESGVVIASRSRADRHVFLEEDLSGHFTPDQWGDLVVTTCVKRRCAGVVIERTGLGDHAASTISAACKTHSMVMRILDPKKPFPAHTPGVVYVREVTAARSKGSRAGGPATETEAGRVHVVGRLDSLESEFTTYVPGSAQSPNRFDAAVYAILELAELTGDTPAEPVGELKAGLSANDTLKRLLIRAPARRI